MSTSNVSFGRLSIPLFFIDQRQYTVKGLEQVRGIHFMMTGNERVALRNYLQCFESRKKGHKPQSVILLDLIEKYSDNEKVLSLLKKKVATEDARRMIIKRLREKMLSSLLLDINLDRDDVYDEFGQAFAKVATGRVQATLLVGRGQRSLGFHVLDRTIQLAKKFELYADLVELLRVKKRFVKNFDKNYSDNLRVGNEIQNYEACRDAVHLAREYHAEIAAKYGFKGLSRSKPEQAQVDFLKIRIDELNTLFDETSSASVGHYLYYLLVEYNQMQGRLKEAEEHLNSWANMTENNPAIKKRTSLLEVYGNIATNQLWMYNYKEATVSFQKTLSFVRQRSRNHIAVVEFLYYAQFYSLRFNIAATSVQSVLEDAKMELTDFRKALFNYMLACVAFAQGELKKVPRYLMNSHDLDKDKKGWNISSRVLAILHGIEQENFDYVDSLIVNHRQFFRDGLKDAKVRQRDRLILEVLLELRKQSYNLQEVQESKQSVLTDLAKNDADTGWMPQTPELICFHTWFDDKLNDRPHHPNYAPLHIYKEA